jgi:aminoglycoside 6'-N-acetyltransferase
MHFTFEPLSVADLPLLRSWLLQPHVSAWFGEPAEWLAEIAANLHADWVGYFRADLDGRPAGFAQCYDTSRAPPGEWSSQPPGTLGLDFLLGRPELLGQGHGTRLLREFIAHVIALRHPRRLITDPDPRNERSVRVAQACGFLWDDVTGLLVKDVP